MGICYREEAVPEGSSTPRMAERSRVATRQSITPWRCTVVAAGYEQNPTYQDHAKSPKFFRPLTRRNPRRVVALGKQRTDSGTAPSRTTPNGMANTWIHRYHCPQSSNRVRTLKPRQLRPVQGFTGNRIYPSSLTLCAKCKTSSTIQRLTSSSV